MINIFELSKHELWWIEDKFERYQQLDEEIALRKENLSLQEPDNSSIESQVIKEQSDLFIITRERWKEAIGKVYENCTEEEQKVLTAKFWSNQNHLSWQEVGEAHHYPKSTIYDMRYSILERFAKEIGHI